MTMSKMSLDDAKKMDLKDLRDDVTNSKISKIFIDGDGFEIKGKTWSNFSIKIADWINKKQGLKLPVYNHAGQKKLCEKTPTGHPGSWQDGKGFYIDTKYAASEHILNAIHICKEHGISLKRIEFEYEKYPKNVR